MEKNYEDLANAIIVQAVKDYRMARHRLKHFPRDKAAQGDIRSITQAAETLRATAEKAENENATDSASAFIVIKSVFDVMTAELKTLAGETKEKINNALLFCEKAFGADREISLLVTELTAQKQCAKFIGRYGCEQYFRFNKELLISERHNEITREILELNLD